MALVQDDVTSIAGNPKSPGCQTNSGPDGMSNGHRHWFCSCQLYGRRRTKTDFECIEGYNNLQVKRSLQLSELVASGNCAGLLKRYAWRSQPTWKMAWITMDFMDDACHCFAMHCIRFNEMMNDVALLFVYPNDEVAVLSQSNRLWNGMNQTLCVWGLAYRPSLLQVP